MSERTAEFCGVTMAVVLVAWMLFQAGSCQRARDQHHHDQQMECIKRTGRPC